MSAPLRAALVLGLLAGCSAPPPPPPAAVETLTGTLDVEIRNHVDVRLGRDQDGSLATHLVFTDGTWDLFDRATPLDATGEARQFPEAGLTLYTARFQAAPIPTGPCAAQPISLALALSRRGSNARIGGSLTAYCGADTYQGVPSRVIRLTGTLSASAP